MNTELTELTVKQLRWIVSQANGDATLAEAIEDCADAERREVEARAPQRPPAAVLRRMKRHAVLLGVAAVAALTVVGSVLAVSNAHFVGTPTASRSGNTLTVSGKVAGLGDVEVITVTISADAACVNPGSNKPKAGNKQSISSTEDEPVQNGKALFSSDLTATFQPDCTPPMTVEFSNVVVTVTAADGTFLQHSFPGTL